MFGETVSFAESLQVTVLGMGVVFVVLVLLMYIIKIMEKVMYRVGQKDAAPIKAAPEQPASAPKPAAAPEPVSAGTCRCAGAGIGGCRVRHGACGGNSGCCGSQYGRISLRPGDTQDSTPAGDCTRMELKRQGRINGIKEHETLIKRRNL